MGLRDTADQLDACRQQSLRDEARILELERDLEALADAREKIRGVDILERQIAELEHENARLESALADRIRTDAHGTAAVEAELLSARARLAAIAYLVHPLTDGEPLTAGAVRRILDEVTAEPWGAFLDLEQAALAGRACRHSAASIRTVLEVDPDRLHPDVAPYASRLDDLADRLQAAR